MILQMIIVVIVMTTTFCGADKPHFDGKNAFAYLVAQCDFGPRNPGSKGHEDALRYLVSELASTADSVKMQPFTFRDDSTGESFDMTNIIAYYRPDLKKRVLIGAHWDTRPRADQDPNPARRNLPIIGANDGASGVAVILELGRLLKQFPPNIGVDLVLFDGEDYGPSGNLDYYCLGSKHYATTVGDEKPEWAVVVDMVGDIDLEIPIERYSYQHSSKLVNEVWSAAERAGAKQFKRNLGTFIYDDHLILIENAGINAIDIIDFDYSYGARNFWHTHEDTPDKCSPSSLAAVGQTLVEMIY